VFSTATWVLKIMFSGAGNDQIGGLGSTLFLQPTAPYWYLYYLFLIFLIIPTFSGMKSAAIGLAIAFAQNSWLASVIVPADLCYFEIEGEVLKNRVTKFFSGISMKIYLSHMVIFRVVEKFGINKMFGSGWLQYAVTVVAVLCRATIFAVVMQKIIAIAMSRIEQRVVSDRIKQRGIKSMRVLMINKFLYPNGGSETYIFKLGEYLEKQGHEVQYFGMEHKGRCVGNRVNAYTSDMDFHGGSKLAKLTYPFKTIYSSEARKKLGLVLDDFKPDVCHLNNFNYQLTPSIILKIVKWRKKTKHDCKIVFTAHDYQLVCPNHMLNNPNIHENCEKCLGSHFINCTKGKCIHGSTAKSVIGTLEAEFWKLNGAYKYIDTMICCSEFMKTKLDTNPLFAKKTVAMHNFIVKVEWKDTPKKDYVLYFGRFSKEKGIGTLIKVCKELPEVPFIFAGTGPLEESIKGIPNIKNVGFQKGAALERLIHEAKFSIYPSEWYENCPFSVMESQMYGTPVLGAKIGGIPELIQVGKTGELFDSGNAADLKSKIQKLWNDKVLAAEYSQNCKNINFDTIDAYYDKLMKIYK